MRSDVEDEIIPKSLSSDELNGIDQPSSQAASLSNWIVHFLLLIQAKFRLSDLTVSFFLKILITVFKILGLSSKVCADIFQALPSSLSAAHLRRGIITFNRYVVCKKCHTIRTYSDCVEGSVYSKRSKTCNVVAYANHPQHCMRSLVKRCC